MAFVVPDDAVLLADGGLATELEVRGHSLADTLWSARLLADAPEEITAAHRTFFRAGAEVATTASYQASFDGFAARGIPRRLAARLLRRSVELARIARSEVDAITGTEKRRWIAASVGPYGAAQADGSEYRGRYGLSVAGLRAWHRPRLETLAEAGPDVLALETIPDIDEAQALVELLDELEVPAWLTLTVEDGRTRAGQSLAEAFEVAAGSARIVAVGVNCCAPREVTAAVATARAVTGKPVIVYPNSGEGWDERQRRWTGPVAYHAELAREWIAEGVRIVGGCCRVGPSRIAALARIAAAHG